MVEQQRTPEARADDDHASPEAGGQLAGLAIGSVLGASGIFTALIGAVTSLSERTVDVALPLTSMGILMGVAAYAIGAQAIGKVATGFATAALFFAVLVSAGELPGTEPTDHNIPDREPRGE